MTNQTTKTATDILTLCANYRAHNAHTISASAPTSTDTKQDTRQRLQELAQHRNDLLTALALDCVRVDFDKTVNDLCDTMAQIAVYKTLLHLSDNATSLSTHGAKMCEKLYFDFVGDMHAHRTHDISATFSDAMDLYHIAYMAIWQYLTTDAPLSLDDIVLTIPKKGGGEKNYTLFQTACKSIRESINAWSKTDTAKKIHYLVGIADNGAQVVSSKRPHDPLTDIDASTEKAFFDKYGLTAHEQDICALLIRGEKPDTIAELLNIPKVTAYKQIAKTKAKFATASAYSEYVTAKNAEKKAKSRAKNNPDDPIYSDIYAKAQERTAQALTAWQVAFHKGV